MLHHLPRRPRSPLPRRSRADAGHSRQPGASCPPAWRPSLLEFIDGTTARAIAAYRDMGCRTTSTGCCWRSPTAGRGRARTSELSPESAAMPVRSTSPRLPTSRSPACCWRHGVWSTPPSRAEEPRSSTTWPCPPSRLPDLTDGVQRIARHHLPPRSRRRRQHAPHRGVRPRRRGGGGTRRRGLRGRDGGRPGPRGDDHRRARCRAGQALLPGDKARTGERRLHRTLKDVFDPLGILNPGKILRNDVNTGDGDTCLGRFAPARP